MLLPHVLPVLLVLLQVLRQELLMEAVLHGPLPVLLCCHRCRRMFDRDVHRGSLGM